jgi:hypothetical protein
MNVQAACNRQCDRIRFCQFFPEGKELAASTNIVLKIMFQG